MRYTDSFLTLAGLCDITGSLELDQPQQNSSQKENRYNFSSTRSSYHGIHGHNIAFFCLLLFF